MMQDVDLILEKHFPRLVEWYDSIAVKDITDDEINDIPLSDSTGITNTLYAKRIVTEDGEVKVVEMKVQVDAPNRRK